MDNFFRICFGSGDEGGKNDCPPHLPDPQLPRWLLCAMETNCLCPMRVTSSSGWLIETSNAEVELMKDVGEIIPSMFTQLVED
ncbi:hypothetical protein IFM89_020338 [Coptis chinensis]|uniref:Uncharacterized protein n=1 Tax=Coptis chinensis TaxID=261450 RepID=A0A835H9X7_9MAGN|nr:hypothetical protein IFM89_020338 [Coptis chinensis]